ncbi:hypothetical protein JWR97_07745 [Pseudomonas cedrina subsp. fulgida]|nr:hypothetical protein [Pseudomonas cedrina subsp. fulgida]
MKILNDIHKESLVPSLESILTDGRLARLFSKDARHCALQLWILQIKSEQLIENRVVYGRLLPYNHSSNCWYSSDDDDFHTFKQVQAQVIQLNLYVESVHCADILRQLCASRTVEEVSQDLNLVLSDRLKSKFGTTTFASGDLVYRPVSYLLNRDAHDQGSASSPHGGAGAFSASITQIEKGSLFRLGQDYDIALTALVIKQLNADTGLDFGRVDAARLGDLELLVFPALDDLERGLLTVSWTDAPRYLIARFDPLQVPHFNGFHFRLCIANGGQIVYSCIALAERNSEDMFECRFALNDQLHARIDSTELEIFGFHGEHSSESTLCCRWRIGYFREIHIQGHVVGQGRGAVKFDWLERTTRPSVSARVKTALTITRGDHGFTSRIGGREADPWVPVNHDLVSLFARLHPPKSEGRFFLRWGEGDGDGRLQFVEWFRALLAKYQQHQIIIFDPYFDGTGLGLVSLCAVSTADYIVFRSLPKPVKQGKPLRRRSDKNANEGINNLLANCEQSSHLLERIKLRIYGLKEGRLHDRYILIMAPDNLPVAGFNLSNSLQAAAQYQPLLVTPIPADVLLKVEQYKSGLIQEALAVQSTEETENPSMRLLFDSTVSPKALRRYEPLLFLEKAQAGEVLSVWTAEPSLKGLSGGPLKVRMAALDLLNGDSLQLPETEGLHNCLEQQAGDFANFTAIWDVLGEVLAHSRTGDHGLRELESECGFLAFLASFLEVSFSRAPYDVCKELAVIDAWFFRAPLEDLLRSSYRPHHLFHATKYAALTWPEYFAIKFMWWHASDVLLEIAEGQMLKVRTDPQEPDVMRLSLLSQIVSEIAFSMQFDLSEVQRGRLIHSRNGLFQWMGLNALEMQLDQPGGFGNVLQVVATFSYSERVRALGWMVNHAAGNPTTLEIYKGLVTALHDALPSTITADDLTHLVDSMRGHMRQLAWAEPWLFQDVLFPLLSNDQVNINDASDIWANELLALLGPELKHQSRLFERARQGQTTGIAAFLFAYSSLEQQKSIVKSMQVVLRRQQRIVQQPLASTSDWTRWNDALVVSMWIFAFTRWCQYYLSDRDMTNRDLEELSRGARKLAMVRPMGEWRSDGTGKPGELAAFFDQAEALLASNDE